MSPFVFRLFFYLSLSYSFWIIETSFVSHCSGCGTDGYNVIDTDHISDGTSYILKSNNQYLWHSKQSRCFKLQRRKQSIRYCAGTRHKGTEHSDQCQRKQLSFQSKDNKWSDRDLPWLHQTEEQWQLRILALQNHGMQSSFLLLSFCEEIRWKSQSV